MHAPSILCPVDFSEPSRSALSYAAALADHFGARLTVLAVDDPLLADAAAAAGIVPTLVDETRRDLQRFCAEVFTHRQAVARTIEYRVTTGKPSLEILRVARELNTDLIVISSHGRGGLRKLFLGSTTERVLREAPVPVLVTSGEPPRAESLSEIARHLNRVLAPVDLTPVSRHQASVAHRIAEALAIPLIVAHVVEPVFVPARVRDALRGAEDVRRTQAYQELSALVGTIDPNAELIVLTGDASEEIDTLARAREANLIVMGLHSSRFGGPRMGSVTYRVLCLSHVLVLAIPPQPTQTAKSAAPSRSSSGEVEGERDRQDKALGPAVQEQWSVSPLKHRLFRSVVEQRDRP